MASLCPDWVYWGNGWFGVQVVRFVKLVFVQIVSDARLLCFQGSVLDTGIGYFVGDPLIGGIAGSIPGVINYELVSKR